MAVLKVGRALYHTGVDEDVLHSPVPVVKFAPVWLDGRHETPHINDKHALLLLRREAKKQVSFTRAWRGWRYSGAHEAKELGQGRAFLRWLTRHELAIAWGPRDVEVHPYFTHPEAPRHDPRDEFARGMSFALAPVELAGKKVKLYLLDEDVLRLLHLAYGHAEDFTLLVTEYILQRRQWQAWQAPAPPFVEWLLAQGKKPLFKEGQLGLSLPFVPRRR